MLGQSQGAATVYRRTGNVSMDSRFETITTLDDYWSPGDYGDMYCVHWRATSPEKQREGLWKGV